MTETHLSDQPSGYIDDASGSEVKYRIKSSQYIYSDANKLIRNVEYMKDSAGNEVLQKVNTYFYDKNGNELSVNASCIKNSTGSQVSLGLYNYDTSTIGEMDSKIDLTNNEYDGFNRLIKVDSIKNGKRSITEYVYNGDDLRVKKTVKNSSTEYVPDVTYYLYDRQHVILETNSSDNVKVRYIRGINYIARLDVQNKPSYYLYNGHGDVVQTVAENGTKENQYDYDIFGQATLINEIYNNSIRYSGEFYDSETGLYYLRARYYDPNVGRFISEDSFWGEDDNPLSLNLYTYGLNDPIRFIDPSGHVVQFVEKPKPIPVEEIEEDSSTTISKPVKSSRINQIKEGVENDNVGQDVGNNGTGKHGDINEYLIDPWVLDDFAKQHNLNDVQIKALHKINEYYNNDKIKENGGDPIVFFFEGAGSYNYKNANPNHPEGRYGAMAVVVKDGKIVYISHNASTLPDNPNGTDGKKGIATVKPGVYDFKSGLHRSQTGSEEKNINKYPALHVNGNGPVPASRPGERDSTATGIHIHMGYSKDNKNRATSLGCLIIHMNEYGAFADAVGFAKDGKAGMNDKYIPVSGVVVVDRSLMK